MKDDEFHTLGPWQNVNPFQAALILFCDKYGRVCMQFRDDFKGVKSPNLWGFFGGEIEKGESAKQAAVRELKEETGLDVPENKLRPFVRTLSETGNAGQHYVSICDKVVDVSELSLYEGAGFAFIHKGQLDSFEFVPSAKRVLSYYFSEYG